MEDIARRDDRGETVGQRYMAADVMITAADEDSLVFESLGKMDKWRMTLDYLKRQQRSGETELVVDVCDSV